eukprot:4884919-Prymnesium_polylepis.1
MSPQRTHNTRQRVHHHESKATSCVAHREAHIRSLCWPWWSSSLRAPSCSIVGPARFISVTLAYRAFKR